jgi:hypothetical protein
MTQKFELKLLARKVFADADGFARRLLEDLKGCTILDVTSAGERFLSVTMQANVSAEHTTEELRGPASAIRIVCERAGVIITDVRRIKTGGLLDEVNRRLPAAR